MAEKASQMPLSGASRLKRNEKPADASPASDRGASGSAQWLATLGRRALSAVVLIPIVIALVFFGGWVAFAAAALALFIGAYELHGMFAHKGLHPLTSLSVVLGLDFLLAAMFYALRPDPLIPLTLVGLGLSALIIISFAWLMLTRKTLDGILADWGLTLAAALYLGWPLAFFLLLRGSTLGTNTLGFWWLLALFFMVWTNDTFALLTGHYFGHTKLAPLISPAKTWEGFFGGLVFTVIAALVFTIVLPNIFYRPLGVPWYHAVILGILVAIASTVGDLAESLLKRGTGVKDSGTIVPGHGGILDRMDSLLFAVLVVFFYAAFLHAIAL
jgi:phosphatidate cytidylyltransferase